MRELGVESRGRRRAEAEAGFTLVELMVVVVLIAIVAMLAVPSMAVAREDRLAFREANAFAELIHGARTQAMGRGAAQLVTITTSGTDDRGTVLVYESLDGTGRPQSSCRMQGAWAGVGAPFPGAPTNPIRGGENINGAAGSLVVTAGLQTSLNVNGVTGINAAAICFTPGGRTYVTTDASPLAAANALTLAPPFNGDLTFSVTRNPHGSAGPVGLTRDVIMTSAGATRIRSQPAATASPGP
ncbi:MAG: prepilin-type N-terminal cleavage/methylation domain-containing protein [Polyangiaceae bacterium]|nr:prepilin-type N-terminal cleavage/methylation domain-containing protein [Polyangiaceae bacterium]